MTTAEDEWVLQAEDVYLVPVAEYEAEGDYSHLSTPKRYALRVLEQMYAYNDDNPVIDDAVRQFGDEMTDRYGQAAFGHVKNPRAYHRKVFADLAASGECICREIGGVPHYVPLHAAGANAETEAAIAKMEAEMASLKERLANN